MRRSSTAATAAPASRRSARAGDLDSPAVIIIAAIALGPWGLGLAAPPRSVGEGAVPVAWVRARPSGLGRLTRVFVARLVLPAPFGAAPRPNGHLDSDGSRRARCSSTRQAIDT